MATQTNVNIPKTVVKKYAIRQSFFWSLAGLAILILALIAGISVTTLTAAEPQVNSPPAFEVEATRYSGLADYYNTQRAIEASAARNSGMATFYTAKTGVVSTFVVLAENPELSVAQRYAAKENKTETNMLADNPELMVARRYTPVTIDNEVSDSNFLASNPELAVAQRNAATVEWHRRHFPGR